MNLQAAAEAVPQALHSAIFAPVAVLALWTWLILLLTGFRRVRAVVTRQVKAKDLRMGDAPGGPAELAITNRNLMNLLEMPVLFYVVCLAFYVTGQTSLGVVGLAWAFVGLRLLHSLIHIWTYRMLARLIVFLLSNLVLLALWLWFIWRVLY